MPAAIPIVAAVAGGAATVYAANKSSSGAKSAANAQTQAANSANQTQYQIYQQQRQDNEPFRQNALAAQSEYMQLLGLSPYQAQAAVGGMAGGSGPQTQGMVTGQYNPKFNTPENAPWGEPPQAAQAAPAMTSAQSQQAAFDRFRNTPGYQFGLNTGFDQVQASAAARGGLYSGATLKALQKFGNDYADQQGYSPYMNRLANLAGMGQTANSQNQAAGQNYANQTGNNLISAGNARASGIQNSANAWGNAAGNITGIAGWLAGQYKPAQTPAPSGADNYNWASNSGFGNNYGSW